jgi:ribosome-associated protein
MPTTNDKLGLSLSKGTSSARDKSYALLRAALSAKASAPTLIRLGRLTSLTDYFLIVSARSARHVRAVAERILDEAKQMKFHKLSAEGLSQGNWALMDYGDVIVHVFQQPVRDFYDLEGLWAEAPREKFPEDIMREIELMETEPVEDDLD